MNPSVLGPVRVSYFERNPVRARRCVRPQAWVRPSAAAHLAALDDAPITVRSLLEMVPARLGGFFGSDRRRACRRSAPGSRHHRASARYRRVRRVVGEAPPTPFNARKVRAKAPGAGSLYQGPVRRARAELGKLSPELPELPDPERFLVRFAASKPIVSERIAASVSAIRTCAPFAPAYVPAAHAA